MSRKYPEGFYVYLHMRESDGLVFYVGKGKGYRAWEFNPKSARNPYWQSMKSKHGVVVEIYKSEMTEPCAFTLEKILISKYKSLGHPLTNLTNGGDGFDGVDESLRLEAFMKATAKRVKTSLGEEFRSTSEAQNWLRKNGYPKATGKAISEVALGRRTFAYGRSWSYEDQFPAHPQITDAIAFAKSMIARPVVRSDGMEFESAHFAARYLANNSHPRASSSSIAKACKGKLKSCYGFTWGFK